MIFLFALLFSSLFCLTQTVYAAVPVITTQSPLLESGSSFYNQGIIDGVKTDTSLTLSPEWSRIFLRPLGRIQLTGTQTCLFVLGIGGFNLQFGQDQSQVTKMKSQASFVSGALNVSILMSNRNKFTSFKITYLMISSALTDFYVQKQQFAVSTPLSSSKFFQKTYTNLPPIGTFTQYRVYVSLFSMELAYQNLGKDGLQFIIQTIFTGPNKFNYTLSSSQASWNPFIEVVDFYVLITPMDKMNNFQKANIVLQQQLQKPTLSGIDEQRFQFIPYVKTTTNFMSMLYGFRSASYLGDFNFIIETNAKLSYKAANTLAEIWVQIFLLYAQTCPINFYYSDNGRQCERCVQYCGVCDPTGTCDLCFEQFTPSPNFDKCSCLYEVVSNLCYDFDNSPMKYCATAFNKTSIIECSVCKASLYRTLVNNECVCRPQFQLNSMSQKCEEVCGDGIIFNHQCDDGNLVSGDGCTSKCEIQNNFNCIRTTFYGPSYCWSLININFKIASIMKNKDNSAVIELTAVGSPLPFGFSVDQFVQTSFGIILKSEQSSSTATLNPSLISASGNIINLKIDYEFTIQDSISQIQIDMSKSRYPTYNPKVYFSMKGDNFPLVFSSYVNLFQTTSLLMLVVSIISLVLMLIGGISNKFIGIQAAVTLQLIFYSQILISPISKFPVGFVAFQFVKYINGYNEIFSVTDYDTITTSQFKFHYLGIQKTFIQYFNINFGFLFITFLVFVVTCLFQSNKEKFLLTAQDTQINPSQLKGDHEKLKFWLKFSVKAYNFVSQISMWSILQFFAGCAAQLMISNANTYLTTSQENAEFFHHFNEPVVVMTIFIIMFIGLNCFGNVFLSQLAVGKFKERPMELKYKRAFFVYLLIVGFLILFLSDVLIMKMVPMSVIVLLVHFIYIGVLAYINPYKMTLRIHTVGLFTCQGVYGMFLIFINIINFLPLMHDLMVIGMVYGVFGLSLIMIIMTVVRLYYEYRYGVNLEKEIQKQRQMRQKKRIEMQEAEVAQIMRETYEKAQIHPLQNPQNLYTYVQNHEATYENPYLHENQLQKDKRDDLIYWLQNRENWTKQQKEEYYMRKYKTKPLKWVKEDDPKKYQKLMIEKEEKTMREKERSQSKRKNPEYEAIMKRLNQEFMVKMEKL